MLVDSHCHLDFPKLAEDRAAVLANARAAGVKVMQTIGTRLSAFDEVLKIAEAEEGVYCSVGVHPHRADQEGPAGPAPLLARVDHPKVIGIGEAGLDYFHKNSTPEKPGEGFSRPYPGGAGERASPDSPHPRCR